jgi:replicative DNA helicase
MTPATPDRAHRDQGGTARSEHVRYGRIVLDNSVRRQVAAAGTRIDQLGRAAAEYDSQQGAVAMEPALSGVQAALVRLGGRVAQAHSDGVSILDVLSGSQLAPFAPGEPAAGPAAGIASGNEAPTPATVERAERALLGACMVSPEIRSAAAEWLRPEDFATAEAAQSWQVVLDMTRRGDPVDFVLVAVEVETALAAGEPPGFDPTTLHRLAERADRLAAHRAAEVIGRAALQRVMHRARTALEGIAGDRAVGTRALLQNAQQAVKAAQRTSQRLGGQSAPSIAAAMFAAPVGPAAPAGAVAMPRPRPSSSKHPPPTRQQTRADSPQRRR